MNMIEAVKSCFRQYVGFRGRAQRSEFWYWTLFTILVGLVLGVIDGLIFGWASDNGPLGSIFSLATLLPGLAVAFRRLHDTGRSGWWIGGFYLAILIFVILIISVALGTDSGGGNAALAGLGVFAIIGGLAILGYGIMLIVFFCQPSQKGDNKYGPNPIEGSLGDIFG